MENFIEKCLGNNLKLLRQKKAMSRKAFSRCVGISEAYVNLIEQGKRFPSASVIEKIAHALEIPVSRLFKNEVEIFEHVSKDDWTEFQLYLEKASVYIEKAHEMIEIFHSRKR